MRRTNAYKAIAMAITMPARRTVAKTAPAINHGDMAGGLFAAGRAAFEGAGDDEAAIVGRGPLRETLASGLATGMAPLADLVAGFTTGCGPDLATEFPVTTGIGPDRDFLSPEGESSGLAMGSDLAPDFLVLLPGLPKPESPFLVSTRFLS